MNQQDLPVKTHEMHNHHFDSTKWNHIKFRDDDIIVTTAYKSGTTWVQNILLQLLYQGREIPANHPELCPWVDLRIPPIEVQGPSLEAQTERRSLKTHLQLDALIFSPKAKYIYVERDGRDCYMSLINHYRVGNDLWYQALNETPGLQGPPLPHFTEEEHSSGKLFDRWIQEGGLNIPGETDGYPFWSLFDHVRTWWNYRHLPNILFLHYADMLADTEGAIREIAHFINVPIQEEHMKEILQAVSLEGMRNKLLCIPADAFFTGGSSSFVFKGVNGRWKGILTEEQLAKYDAKVKEKLDPDCARWLEFGRRGFDPRIRK